MSPSSNLELDLQLRMENEATAAALLGKERGVGGGAVW
jgi:hypothetical protein